MIPDRLDNSGVVTIKATAPINMLDGNFWLNSSNNSLFVRSGGAWIPVSGGGGGTGSQEVFVGPTKPTGTETLWVDTSTLPTLKMLVSSSWKELIQQPTLAGDVVIAGTSLNWIRSATLDRGRW